MSLDSLFSEIEERRTAAHPALRLWLRNMRRERDAGRLPAELCDAIADAVEKEGAPTHDISAVARVLQSDTDRNPALRARLLLNCNCVERIATVVSAAAIALYYDKANGYAMSTDEVEDCAKDIDEQVLSSLSLQGRLRGKLDLAWFTNADELDNRLHATPSNMRANLVRDLLGLTFGPGDRLVRLDAVAENENGCVIALPTTVEAAGHPYFVASRGDDHHGWTLHLRTLERSLPEWTIHGVDASSTTLCYLGPVDAAASMNWTKVIDQFDENKI